MKKISNKENTKYKGKILIIDDEPEVGLIFSKILDDNGYEVISSPTGKDGLDKVQSFMPDLVFLDLKLTDKDGIDVLKDIKEGNPDIMVIIITAYGTVQTAVAAMKLGAYDYIPKPIPNERLKIIVDKALEGQRLYRQIDLLNQGGVGFNGIIWQSQAMQGVFRLIRSAASHDVSVILRGESGTGKELVARAIHRLSRRKDKPFVPVDCATLPETLIESELFGYEKGAFTGAYGLKIGKFERACGGTLFLDEIGNLIIHAQVKLLRILQEGEIERLGGQKEIKIDARIITATNIDLEDAVRRGEFRDDLYHRLNVFEITLPALRERREDIILLLHYFLDKFNKEMGKKVKGFSDEVLEIFNRYHWPGNVRELENTIRSAIILAEERILPSHLTFHIKRNLNLEKGTMRDTSTSTLMGFLNSKDRNLEKISLKETKRNMTEDLERYLIEKTLNQTNWNKKKAANILDIDYKGLFNKIKKYNLKQTI